MEYIHQLEANDPAKQKGGDGCFLCEAAAIVEETAGAAGASDRAAEGLRDQYAKRLVLLSDERGMVILNRFPYTTGHLLIAPREHVAGLTDLSPAQRGGLMELMVLGQETIEATYNPQGMNVGMNLGRCAGAGLPGHLHIHVVPRWGGDTNFMSVVGGVRVMPQRLEQSFERLRDAMARLLSSRAG